MSEEGSPVPERDPRILALDESLVWDALSTVVDPEIGLDIVILGLVYGVELSDEEPGVVRVTHSLTTPGCPMETPIRHGIQVAVEAVPGVVRAKCELVWDPPWTPQRIDPDAWSRPLPGGRARRM